MPSRFSRFAKFAKRLRKGTIVPRQGQLCAKVRALLCPREAQWCTSQTPPVNPKHRFLSFRGSKNGKYINNVVTDTKSVTSLIYHIPFFNNHRRSQNRNLGNTYQFYIWRTKK